MNMILARKKIVIIIGIIIAVLALIFGLLWYYQGQGLIKVFPTREERQQKRVLQIDRAKFSPAEGLLPEQFEAKIKELEDYKKKLEANPNDPQTWFNFGYNKQFLNDHEGAVAAWLQALARQPLNFVTTSNLANTYQYFLKDYQKAEDYYRKTLEIKPDYTAAYQGLADIYRFNVKEKQNELEPLLLEAIQKDIANQVTYYSLLIEFFAEEMNLPKAKEYLAALAKIDVSAAAKLVEIYPDLNQ